MAVRKAPAGFWGVLLVLGPSLVWCGEYIGSGEVLNATRAGAALGPAVLWAVVFGIFLKYWIGLCGARYTVVTGEGMVDCFSRVPGPRNWLVAVVFFVQVAAGICSIGALATAAATFLQTLFPLGPNGILIWGAGVTAFAFFVALTGRFGLLKQLMALLVGIIVVGVLYVAAHSLPPFKQLLIDLFGFAVPPVPDWVRKTDPKITTAWAEILPLIGWAAGGFASQVWYSYWVLGAGYGMAQERSWGEKADEKRLAGLSEEEARSIRGWIRVVAWDATSALVIGSIVTGAFLIAGAGILRPARILPHGEQVAFELSRLFSEKWGSLGATLFLLAGSAAMISTQLGQFAGWPRLLADCARILFPVFRSMKVQTRFRLFLILFILSNLLILALFGTQPVALVKLGSIFDGLLLVPLQAFAVLWGLFVAQRRLIPETCWPILKPRWYHALGLIVAFAAFTYICVFQVPATVHKLLSGFVK